MSQNRTLIDLGALTATERLMLAQQLLDSVVAEAIPLSPLQMDEVQRRAATLDASLEDCEAWQSLRSRQLPPA